MKLKISLTISALISIALMISIDHLVKQDFDLTKQDNYKSNIEVWIITPSLTDRLKAFQDGSNIKVKTKSFPDSPSLLKELETAKLNNDLPDVIELNANDVTEKFIDNFHVKTVDTSDIDLNESIKKRFQFNDNVYAYPIGIDVPIMIYNKSLLNDMHHHLFPFSDNKTLKQYEEVQSEIRKKKPDQDFWLFHFDKDVGWYWQNTLLTNAKTTSFHDVWDRLVRVHELVPPLDHEMAITRFSNVEVGALITSTKNLQTIQRLVGNKFKIEVQPLIKKEDDAILISGNGLMVLDQMNESEELFAFLNEKEQELELLTNSGLLPTTETHLERTSFIQQLPMGKYLQQIVEYQDTFTGKSLDDKGRNEFILEQAYDIEKEMER